jgi:hypothetical protein
LRHRPGFGPTLRRGRESRADDHINQIKCQKSPLQADHVERHNDNLPQIGQRSRMLRDRRLQHGYSAAEE